MSSELNKAINYLKKNDKVISKIIDNIGKCNIKPSKDYYTSLVKSIIYQQLSVKAAKTIYDRFLNELNGKLNPESVLNLSEIQFKRAGVSGRKQSYLIDLSRKFINREIDTNNIQKLNDEELINLLTTIRGIGRWSAEMFMIFCLNRLNVLPLEDLGFQRALKINYGLKKMPTKNKIIMLSKNWGSYRSIAVWYLWQSINKNGG